MTLSEHIDTDTGDHIEVRINGSESRHGRTWVRLERLVNGQLDAEREVHAGDVKHTWSLHRNRNVRHHAKQMA